GAVERYSFNKSAFFKFMDRHTKMLPCSWHIHKFQVHHLCAALFGKLQYLFGCHALNSPFFYPTMAAEIAGLSCLYLHLAILHNTLHVTHLSDDLYFF